MQKFLSTGAIFFLCFAPVPADAAISDLNFTVTLSEPVIVTTTGGTPTISLDIGGTTRLATYTSGSTTNNLTFTYTPQAGDVDLDGIQITPAQISANGGTIRDLAGNTATLTFTAPNTSGIKLNYPSFSMDFVADADGRYTMNGTSYDTLAALLAASGGSFTRASTGTYFDSSGILQTAAVNTPRFDYDPATLTAKGILIEGGSTNNVRNNTMAGAVVGNPGTFPNNWVRSIASGLSSEVTGLGQEDGIDYIEIHIWGTPTASGTRQIRFDGFSHPAVAASINTLSAFVKLTAGSLANISNFYLVMDNADSAQASLNQYAAITIAPTSAALRTQRYSAVSTATAFTNAATAYVRPYMQFQVTSGLAIDMTIRIGLPQIESGNIASSPIKTSSAAVTRALDDLFVTPTAWVNSALGTIYLQAIKAPQQSASVRYYGLYQNGGQGQISLLNDISPARVSAYVTDNAGTSVVTAASATLTTNTVFNSAFAYATNDFAHSVNGASVVTDTSGTYPALTRLAVGNNVSNGTRPINGWIRKIFYYPVRVINAQLQLLSQ